MRKTILAFILFFSMSANAVDTHVATNGNDSNNCLTTLTPCLTIQQASEVGGFNTVVHVADGTYSAGANITHFKLVTVVGNCGNPAAVVINIPGGTTAFWVQDHATGIFSCMTLTTTGNGSTGIAGRQYAIADYSSMRFGAFPSGAHVNATESSKVNCGGSNEVYGGAVYHAGADMHSVLLMPCTINLTGNPAFSLFYVGNNISLIYAYNTAYTGTATGLQYVMEGFSILRFANTVPGNQNGQLYHGSQAF